MSGFQGISEKMQGVASDLANSQTPGYESVQTVIQAQPYRGSNAPAGADAMAKTLGPSALPGRLNATQDPLDIAVTGNAWVQVQSPDGTALTRNGSLDISSAGLLTNSSGYPVLDTNGMPISLPPLSKLEISNDGTISGILANNTSGSSQILGRIGLVQTPSGEMSSLGGQFYLPPKNEVLVQSQDGAVHQGYLNDSNVNPTEAMMEMINGSRSYQMQSEMLKSQSESSQDLNNLLAQG